MFSSFTSFLPSALQQDNGGERKQRPEPLVLDNRDVEPGDDEEDDAAKVKKKAKLANETFIFVRPPPAMSNHPLNLQVQLVPPNPKTSVPPTTATTITPGNNEDVGEPLARTESEVSTASSYAASTSSFSSVSSIASGRRTIVPMYNLQAHNVMTNTIVDAGTDAKVARFTKKGLEMVDLGFMECIEIWASGSNILQTAVPKQSFELQKLTPEHTPGSSSLSLPPDPEVNQAAPPPPLKKHNIFGKLFKSPTSSSHSSTIAASANVTPKASIPVPNLLFPLPNSPTRHGRNLSVTKSVGVERDRSASPSFQTLPIPTDGPMLPGSPRASISVEDASQGPVLMPPTLGIQPTLHSLLPFGFPASLISGERSVSELRRIPVYKGKLPRGPAMYIWVARRWVKPAFLDGGSSLFGVSVAIPSFKDRGNNIKNGSGFRPPTKNSLSEIELRVEWKRSKSKSKSKRRREQSSKRSSYIAERRESSRFGSSRNQSRTSLEGDEDGVNKGTAPTRKVSKRMSLISTLSAGHTSEVSISTENTSVTGRIFAEDAGEDSGEDSDPEDSETPWACVVKVRQPTKPGSLPALKLKLGTMSPTPHHPKVVGMLKVPYPLPDIMFDSTGAFLKNREGGEKPEDHEIALTAEELKDIICSTGMWLVVKEGFGGVGRVGRKGDGWRIRA